MTDSCLTTNDQYLLYMHDDKKLTVTSVVEECSYSKQEATDLRVKL
jgi:hypothetical protein